MAEAKAEAKQEPETDTQEVFFLSSLLLLSIHTGSQAVCEKKSDSSRVTSCADDAAEGDDGDERSSEALSGIFHLAFSRLLA